MNMKKSRLLLMAMASAFACQASTSPETGQIEVPGRWTVEKANAWYARQPWLVGCNYIPANAINQLEMWQADTFDPQAIDRELQMAESLGFNTLRVFLHDLVWEQDQDGLYARMDMFLDICQKHGMRPLFVFFDDCHQPAPKTGVQPLPVPGMHNSGWMNCPAKDVALAFSEGTLPDADVQRLKGFVQGTIRRFKDDSRVLMWELYNEPGRGRGKDGRSSVKLLHQAWVWAREVNPSQPLCSTAEGSVGDMNIEIAQRNSDIISFHCYGNPEKLEERCRAYAAQGRPTLCTEYMARPASTFEGSLPVLKKYNIGAYNWGFVAGKTGTIWPWSSKKGKDMDALRAQGQVLHPGDAFPEPKVWFHDIYRMDGTPYRQSEIDFIKRMTGKSPVNPSASSTKSGKPNILLILADDLGWSDLGCYGGEISTPNLDALARDGLQFREFYNSARCSPSRAGILTGLDPHLAGFQVLGGRLEPYAVTIPEVLKPVGYRSYMAGKWHLNHSDPPTRCGFEEYYGFLGGFVSYWLQTPYVRLPEGRQKRVYPAGEFYATDAFADYTRDFIGDAQKTGAPWFLYLAFSAPHFPLHAPEADIEKYESMYFEKGWDAIREERLARQKKLGLVPPDTCLPPRPVMPPNPWNEHTGWANRQIPAWDSLPEDRRRDLARRMAVYAGAVDHMDRAIGRIVDDLKSSGQFDNTLIFFLSDNGACAEWDPMGFDTLQKAQNQRNILHTGDDLKTVGGPDSYVSYGSGWANACNTPWRLFKHYCQEGGTRTACIVHWPEGLKTKGRVQEAGDILDFMPTICELTGATYPKAWDGEATFPLEGVSLVPAFTGEPLAQRMICREHEGNRSVRDGDWKLVAVEGQPWELYNMADDPMEMHDLAAQHPERVSELDEAWRKWAARNQVGTKEHREGEASGSTVPPEAPQIAGKPITIRCDVDSTAANGVVLAHGGRECGYALYLKSGKPVFAVRVDKKPVEIAGPAAVSGHFSLLAVLEADGTMTLSVDGKKVATGKAPGLIPVQPKDGLDIGKDDLSVVGAYKGPNALEGTVENIRITTEPASGRIADPEYGTVDNHDPQTQIPESVRPLFDTPVRDTQICAAPDGFYYLTGTTMHDGGSFQNWNMGIHVWKSKDLKQWDPLGLVWNLDKTEGWERLFYVYPKDKNEEGRLAEPDELTFEMRDKLAARRGAWANEIHWAPKLNTFVIAGSINHNVGRASGNQPLGHKMKGATFLLKSSSGKAEGPYVDIQPDRPLTPRIDASFFVDDDGSMYFVFQDGQIARLKDDLSGLAEEPWVPQETLYPKEAYAEGAFLFKANGKYQLVKTYWSNSEGSYMDKSDTYSYDPVTASADSIKGPYGRRYTPITGGGHGNFFKDHDGNWWACVFNNPRNQCNKGGWTAMPAIVAMQWVDGRLKVDKERTDAFYAGL